ncbi:MULTISPECIES: hypothetical protein [unclassified Variovorax]|uniref:hypothetical protein n=1 Tax=unclassified Variovorax TaxID=663243 RepID=UPI0008C4FB36|nr:MULTISPECIES: hypothetical protein [unclassified Variovorax]SEK16537.1 hypothetical protein SAMN05518853_1279 [Variovorax sp. OK202]SFE51946.1 hypothetical protein SAMN05444746_1279 [Variovorax sp. OK212]
MPSYSYLWDGTQSGWTLLKIRRSLRAITVVFDAQGPSRQQIQALRRTVPSLREVSAGQAVRQLWGRPSVELGEFDIPIARRLVAELERCGLRVREKVTDRTIYLPFNEICLHALIIEDARVLQQVVAQALRKRLPVRQVQT